MRCRQVHGFSRAHRPSGILFPNENPPHGSCNEIRLPRTAIAADCMLPNRIHTKASGRWLESSITETVCSLLIVLYANDSALAEGDPASPTRHNGVLAKRGTGMRAFISLLPPSISGCLTRCSKARLCPARISSPHRRGMSALGPQDSRSAPPPRSPAT